MKIETVNSYNFELQKGRKVVEGKTHWPDLLRVYIPREEALSLALDILRQLENKSHSKVEGFISLPLSGQLEKIEEN